MLEQTDDETAARRDALIRRAEESRQPFEPEVALFLDNATESEQARQMMEAAQIPFRTLPATGPDIPAAAFGDMLFVGTSGTETLIDGLKKFESALLAAVKRTMPERFGAALVSRGRRPGKSRRVPSVHQPKIATQRDPITHRWLARSRST